MRARYLGTLVFLSAVCCSGGPHASRSSEPLRPTAPVTAATPVSATPHLPPPARDAGAEAATSAPLSAKALDESAAVLAQVGSTSVSLGAPGNGTLRDAVALPRSGPGFVHNVKRPDQARYATLELVRSILKAAASVRQALPGMELVVNDLSLEGGGPIAQHGSHQNGRDADILFYVLDARGEPLRSVGVPLDPDGKGFDFKDISVPEDDLPVRLDVPRTWHFVAALLESAGSDVQRIFIVEHVRSMLLTHAERTDAPRVIRERFAQVSCQPGTPHDDHMHVRFFCAPDDIGLGCFDKPPIHSWQRAALAALGITPQLERVGDRTARRREVAARTTSPEEAKKRAGPMHWKVRKFLARRAAWESAQTCTGGNRG